MNAHRILLEKTRHFSKLFLDYVSQDKKLNLFYKYSPTIDSFSQAIKDISSQKFNRELLVDVITEQYSAGSCQLPVASCQSLLDEKTFTVCTGHQLCLFTGPLYFIYKILSTINLAEELKKKYPSYNFVPVYWMASEDHDFDEVNHINIFGKKIEWRSKQGGALGKYSNEGIRELIDKLKDVLGDSKQANELIELFQNAYTKHSYFSSATRFLVNELFGQYELVIIDANDVRLKNEMKEIFSDEIENHTSFKLVSKTIEELEGHGYKAQVNPREINLFYLTDNYRIRIENKPEAGSQSERTPLEKPKAISPNVVTRPLYQQKILPNVAYVGGPAEISYWLEYKAMFEHYKIFFPVLVPRNFVMLIDESTSDKLKKLGFEEEDVFLSVSKMAEKYISSISDDNVSFNAEKEQLHKQYKNIEKKLALVDNSLSSSAGAELKRQLNAIDVLKKKMLRSFKKKNETAVMQIEKLKQQLFPNNELQERHDNFVPYYMKQGKNFIDELKQNLNPFDFRFTILSEKE